MATFPEAPSVIPDGRISRVRLAALACPHGAFPQQPKLKRWRAYASGWCGSLRGSTRSLRGPGLTRFCARSGGGREPAKCREPLGAAGVLPHRRGSPGSSRRALPLLLRSDGLMRQAKSLSPTSGFPWSGESLQVVASPCCEMALPDVISAILAQALGPPTPRCPSDALTRFFSEGFGLPQGDKGSALRMFPATASAGRTISGLQSFSNVRAPVLARPPGCSHRIHGPSRVAPGDGPRCPLRSVHGDFHHTAPPPEESRGAIAPRSVFESGAREAGTAPDRHRTASTAGACVVLDAAAT